MSKNALTDFVIEANGFRFDAIQAGPADGPLVLFLHGWPEFADAWSAIMAPVAAAGFHAVAVNQRGYSDNARPLEIADYSLDHLMGDVTDFVKILNGGKPFHLVAHDWGGIIAWSYAAAHPKTLLSLSVLATPHTQVLMELKKTDPEQKKKSAYIDIFRMGGQIAEKMLLADDAKNLRASYQGKLPAAMEQENVTRLSQPGVMTAVLNWYRALDLDLKVGDINVPTLYVWGTHDLALGLNAAEGTAARVKGDYTFEKLAGRSHWLLQEAPDEIAPLVLAHLKRNAG